MGLVIWFRKGNWKTSKPITLYYPQAFQPQSEASKRETFSEKTKTGGQTQAHTLGKIDGLEVVPKMASILERQHLQLRQALYVKILMEVG